MDSDITSLATGFTNALGSYLGTQLQAQTDVKKQNQITQFKTEQETQQKKDLADYELKHKATYDPDSLGQLFSQIDPELGGAVKNVASKASQNLGRNLTGEEIKTAFDPIMNSLNMRLSHKEKASEKADLQQDKLESELDKAMEKVVAFRSGGLGLQDSKVNQAIDLRTLLNQYYDPKTGDYNIPPAQHSELALGLARLLSPQGTVPIELEKQIRQSTGREALAHALIYMGADPAQVGGPTQSVIHMFRDSIDRQGSTAERLRDKYTKGIADQYKGRISDDRWKRAVTPHLSSSFNELLSQSPDHEQPNPQHLGKIPVISPDGKRGTIPANQLEEALKAGYKQQ